MEPERTQKRPDSVAEPGRRRFDAGVGEEESYPSRLPEAAVKEL
jgi:hypothetical protein